MLNSTMLDLCNMLCREGLRSTLVDLGGSSGVMGGGKSGVRAGILNTKVAH